MPEDEPTLDPEDEFEARLQALQEKAARISGHAEMPRTEQIGDGFDDRISQLEERARVAKGAHDGTRAEEDRRIREGGEAQKGLATGLAIGYTIVGVPLIGAGIGWIIDSQKHTVMYKGFGALIGAVVGIAMAFVMMNRNQS